MGRCAKLIWFPALTILVCLSCLTGLAHGQSTGGVPGPTINDGEQAVEFRIGIRDPGEEAALAYRVYYRRSISDRIRLRATARWRDRAGAGPQFEYLMPEIMWQYKKPKTDNHAAALRLTYKLATDKTADEVNLSWLHQWKVSSQASVRLAAFASHEVGTGAADGTDLQVREEVAWRLKNKVRLSVEGYQKLGNTAGKLGLSKRESQQIGFAVSTPIQPNVNAYLGVRLPLTEVAPDADWVFRIVRTF